MGYMEDHVQRAEQALARWAENRRESDSDRDAVVRLAVTVGVTKHRVHVITGLARTTIDRIVDGTHTG